MSLNLHNLTRSIEKVVGPGQEPAGPGEQNEGCPRWWRVGVGVRLVGSGSRLGLQGCTGLEVVVPGVAGTVLAFSPQVTMAE